MKRNKLIYVIAIAVLSFLLCACNNQSMGAQGEDDGTIHVVCTIFPQYDWVKQIVGDTTDHVEVSLLLDDGVDLHSYQPTADDMITISEADVFIYVGGESDGWVQDALDEYENEDRIDISLMDVLGEQIKEEELVEGMEAHEEHEDANHEESHEEEGPEYDEHVWLSLKNAIVICDEISEAMQTIDSEDSAVYQSNCEQYTAQLEALDEQYSEMVGSAQRNTVLFGDRFPFRYLVDDYEIKYYAAFVGCSTESNASFETIIFLAQKVDELQIPTVLIIDGSNTSIAKTVIENTTSKEQNILEMNSLQMITKEDVEEGVTYLSVMQDNLETLRQALN